MKKFKTTVKLFLIPAVLPLFLITISPVFAQNPSSANYPYVSPTAAASGMTTGIQNGSTNESINMMQVRAAAQQSERAAAAAAMARTAETAIEEQSLKRALSSARETRRQKMEASERMKWQKATAYNAYNKVTTGQMATWKDQDGNIKVGRGLPSDFVASVKQEEAARAAAAPPARSPGFKPFKKLGEKVAGNNPYEQTGLSSPKPLPQEVSPPPPSQMKAGRRLVSKIRPPKFKAPKLSFPKLGNKKQGPPPETPQFANVPARAVTAASGAAASAGAAAYSTAQSAPAVTAAVAAATAAPAVSKKAAAIPARSGAELLKNTKKAGSQAVGNAQSTTQQAAGAMKKSSGGFFNRNKSKPTLQPTSSPAPVVASNSAPKRFSFGKGKNKESSQPTAPVSSSLFPAGAVASSSGQTPAGATTSNISMPGASTPGRKFSLPKPKLPNPKNSARNQATTPGSAVNRNGNNYYVVNSQAQYMKYGSTVGSSTITSLPSGTIVKMTKPGANWAGITAPDGSNGVVQVKNLRPAAGGELPSF